MALARMIVVRRKACDFHLPLWRRWLVAALAVAGAVLDAHGQYLAEMRDHGWAE